MSNALHMLRDSLRDLHESSPTLCAFAPFPGDLSPGHMPPHQIPVTEQVANWSLPGTEQTEPVISAVRKAACDVAWLLKYTVEEVGQDFLNRYGYFEIYGPTGMFHTQNARGYIACWGAGLHYDWHQHKAEELYYILSGGGEFLAEGVPPKHLGPGETCLHLSNQRHALITHERPILTYVIWRGEGLDGLPEMSAA